jgi:response regulator RpfG family c-di-GMP phosphodiesterase
MKLTTGKLVHTFGALADLGQEITDSSNFDEMVLTSLHLLLGALGIRRGAVAEFDSFAGLLRIVAVRGLEESFPTTLVVDEQARSALRKIGLTAMEFDELEREGPVLQQLLAPCKSPPGTIGVRLFVPMVIRGEVVGVVFLGEKATDESFSKQDLEIISSMIRHIGVGIHTHRLLEQVAQRAEENRRLYEDLRAIYRDTVRAFAAAIDIKDKYTQGHSERVGKYSEIIAREMGWGEEEVEGIAIAGYLHDVGKLVVERDIINAPYHIDAKQSKELNRHPAAGYEILLPIHHPYADIPLMAKYHHERLDGSGYPDGLMGDQIPMGAKIVSVADSFDAMTTDRPYRTRRNLEQVIVDFRANTGSQFEPEVIVALCRALLKELKGETKPRPLIKMLGRRYIDAEKIIPLLSELIAELDPQKSSAAGTT